jgi:hypothetical protein
MFALPTTTTPSPAEPEKPKLLAARWVHIAAGLGLLGLCVLLAVAALRMPFVEISTSAKSYGISGAEQSKNLHLILAVTGLIGAVLALIYALTAASFRATFFVVGGVATGFTALIMLGAWQTVQRGTVANPVIYAEIQRVEAVMQIGSGLWACLGAGLGILALAVVVLRAGRAAEPAPEQTPRKRSF